LTLTAVRNNQQHHRISPLQLTKNFFVYHKLFHSLLLYFSVAVKGKGHPRADHEDPSGEYRYTYIPSSTSTLDGVGGQRHPDRFIPWKGTFYP
jgi:hypothetical protein